MKTVTEIRDAFWLTFYVEGKPHEFWGKSHDQLPEDVRAGFAEYVNYLINNGTVTEKLAAMADRL